MPRVDVMRAVAFLLVLFFHLYTNNPAWSPPWHGLWRDYAAWPVVTWPLLAVSFGSLGVTLFFVISGFCVHLSFLHGKKPFRAGEFFRRRFLRIYPAYFVTLVVCVMLMPVLRTPYAKLYQIPVHLFLVHNLLKSTFMGINPVFWSLGVEAQFYLLYPLLLLWRRRMGLVNCLGIGLVLNVLMQVYLSASHSVLQPFVSVQWSFPLVTWCDWILGAALAEAYAQGRPLFPHRGVMLLLSFALLAAALSFKPLCSQAYLFAAVLFAALMDGYLSWTRGLSWLERALAPVGLVSYSLYLWHLPIILLLVQHLGIPLTNWNLSFIYLPLTVVVLTPIVVLSYLYIEVGVPRWLRRRAAAT